MLIALADRLEVVKHHFPGILSNKFDTFQVWREDTKSINHLSGSLESDLCYTVIMQSDRHIWQAWAHKLHSWGLGDWVASLLEAAGPLTLLGAQVIYLGQPFVGQAAPGSRIEALVKLFEEPEATQSFISILREDTPQ